MGILAAAVVIVGVVGALNLILTYGVIRRLREHTQLIGSGAGVDLAPTMREVGEQVGAFTATAVDGSPVALDQFAGPTLVGVFASGCSTCAEKVPAFVKQAATFPAGRQSVLAVVVADDDLAAAPYVDMLGDVAVVVREDGGGSIVPALGVSGFPAFGLLDGGVVRASALDPAKLVVAMEMVRA